MQFDRNMFYGALVGVALLALPGMARAYTPEALAQYKAGRQFQAAKQWDQAVSAYQAAVAADSTLIEAYKEMGTAYYMNGDNKDALLSYDYYLQSYPDDSVTRRFADHLRSMQGGSQGPSQEAGAPQDSGPRHGDSFRPRWGLDLYGGSSLYAFGAWNNTIDNAVEAAGPSVSGGDVDYGFFFGASFNYSLLKYFQVSLDLDYNTADTSITETNSDGSSGGSIDYSFPVLWVGPSAYLTIPNVFPDVDLRFGGGIGYVALVGASGTYNTVDPNTGDTNTETSSFSGSTVGEKFELGLDWYLDKDYYLGVTLGYRLAVISPVTENPSYIGNSSGTLVQSDGSNLPFDYSGVYAKISLGAWL